MMKPRSKRLGQCFLEDHRVLHREVGYAAVQGKTVLEIGAGDGRLTRQLAKKAKHVTAIEIDEQMLPHLLPLLEEFDNLEILHADFLDVDFEGKKFDVIISNVPYQISSPLTFKIAAMHFGHAVLCFQKEFAERMLAQPDDNNRSRLSVMSQLHFEVQELEEVPRSAFRPMPKVDSLIVKLVRTNFTATPEQAEFINKLFQHKNRTVRKALRDAYGKDAKLPKTEFDERRVFSLANDEILELGKHVLHSLSGKS